MPKRIPLFLGDNGPEELGDSDYLAAKSGVLFGTDAAAENALDDYEEGTFTPAFSNIGTGTYAAQTGRYTKIGRVVTVSIYLEIATVGTASGALVVTGLPFTSLNSDSLYHNGPVNGGSWTTEVTDLGFDISPNASTMSAYKNTSGAAAIATHAELGIGYFLTSFSYQSN